MILNVDKNIVLKQLELSDAPDIFNTIDTQREHLRSLAAFCGNHPTTFRHCRFCGIGSQSLPKDRMEYTFTIRVNGRMAGLIGFKDTDRANKKTEIATGSPGNFWAGVS